MGRGELRGEKYTSTSRNDIRRARGYSNGEKCASTIRSANDRAEGSLNGEATEAILYGDLSRTQPGTTVPDKIDRPWWWPQEGIDPSLLDTADLFEGYSKISGELWSGSETSWLVRAPKLPDEWKISGSSLQPDVDKYLEIINNIKDPMKGSHSCQIQDVYQQNYLDVTVAAEHYGPVEPNPFLGTLANLHQMAAIESLAPTEGSWRFLYLEDANEEFEELLYISANNEILGSVATVNKRTL